MPDRERKEGGHGLFFFCFFFFFFFSIPEETQLFVRYIRKANCVCVWVYASEFLHLEAGHDEKSLFMNGLGTDNGEGAGDRLAGLGGRPEAEFRACWSCGRWEDRVGCRRMGGFLDLRVATHIWEPSSGVRRSVLCAVAQPSQILMIKGRKDAHQKEIWWSCLEPGNRVKCIKVLF